MATISKITTTYIDGTTIITSSLLGEFKSKINDIIDELNSSSTPTPVSNVIISTSVTPTGSGSVTGGGSYAPGASVTLTATAASGYTFSSWSDGNTNATRSITVGNSNLTYTATFVENQPSLTPVVPTIVLNTTAKTVALSATSGLTIKYSTDGSTPTTTYTSAINVANGATIKAVSTNGTQSSAMPKITIKYNENGGTIEFQTSETGTLRYTTDGSNPTSSSTAYSSAITPVSGTTYKVAVYNSSSLVSEIASIVIS